MKKEVVVSEVVYSDFEGTPFKSKVTFSDGIGTKTQRAVIQFTEEQFALTTFQEIPGGFELTVFGADEFRDLASILAAVQVDQDAKTP